ncbi:MAG: hypothetical protein ABEK17_01245 [Candidatus Aenigmatarchaeota archaeon]
MSGTDRKTKRDARRFRLLQTLQSIKRININETADRMGVTTPTLTNDIKELEKLIPNIEKNYGEAVWKDRIGRLHNSEFLQSIRSHSNNKQIIGKYLADNISGGNILAVGIGSTPYYVIKNFSLARLSDLTLVTSNFAALTHLEQETETKLDVYDLGGKFDPAHMGLTRVDKEFDIRKVLEGTGFPFDGLENSLENSSEDEGEKDESDDSKKKKDGEKNLFSHCIITGKSISLEELNLTCNHVGHEMHLRHAYMENSENIYIVLDSSKISKKGKGYISTPIEDYIGTKNKVYVFTDHELSNRDLVLEHLRKGEKKGIINEDIFHFVVINDDCEDKYLYGKRNSTP